MSSRSSSPAAATKCAAVRTSSKTDREDQSTYFIRCNAGKQSIALDLARPEARAVVLDLARASDVVVENFAPGVAARLGADYETLAAVKPDLVYCSISGFGQTGPWRLRPAFAHIINAASGMMHLERGPDRAPRAANLQAADVLAGNSRLRGDPGRALAAQRGRARARASTSPCSSASSPPTTRPTAAC